ncbi:ABC transporter substrate-binding protein [Mycobacterium sp. MYCO198283]|uniref:ABC transporter substrate-binding protein n=1 Tax=Mycobacterium sp. MYCO198283 TaxID=2883505 RepID=UPI001E3DE10F|nr:ABC transporter substrate-binding protein [Mycobacterium sp. MYCO198283]MCG5433488.1 ABC transporter substrate-binding protein [Mycobacterium sp. MYCO198283]
MAAAVAAGLVLVGCSGGGDEGSGGRSINKAGAQPAKVEEIANSLPSDVKDAGKLVIGTNASYPPNESKEGDSFVGFDVDLIDAAAAVLGLTTEYRDSSFDNIIPSVQAGTYDVGVSSFTDTKEREDQVDFVTYFRAGTLWAQRPGRPVDPNNACGLKVAVQSGTTQLEELDAKSKACVAQGKPAITILKFDDQPQATNAVVVEQADAVSADSPVVAWAIQQAKGKLEGAGEIYESAPYGWAVSKDNRPLTEALLAALEELIKTGDYDKIVTYWGVGEQGKVDKPVINGAVS